MENNNTKNMKKFRKPLVIVAMVLMVALVCGMGAMTYSRYISTTDVPAQTATAAQWGFVVTANADNLFGEGYSIGGAPSPAYASVTTRDAGVAVKANSADKQVVAPGTEGSMTIEVNGQAEVRANLVIDVIGTSTDIFYDTYKPIKWTLVKNDNGTPTTLVNKGTLDAVVTALETSTPYDANTTIDLTYTLSWSWAFDDTQEATSDNTKDTLIGLIMAYNATDSVVNKATYPTIQDYANAVLGVNTYTEADFATNKYSTSINFEVGVTVEQVQ